jgi:hypothetical protein
VLSKFISSFGLLTIKKIWVINCFSKLDDNILVKAHRCSLFNCRLFEELPIDALLLFCYAYINMNFNFWRHIFLDLFLDSAEHKRPKNFMELVNNLRIPLFSFFISHVCCLVSAQIEKFIKIFA